MRANADVSIKDAVVKELRPLGQMFFLLHTDIHMSMHACDLPTASWLRPMYSVDGRHQVESLACMAALSATDHQHVQFTQAFHN